MNILSSQTQANRYENMYTGSGQEGLPPSRQRTTQVIPAEQIHFISYTDQPPKRNSVHSNIMPSLKQQAGKISHNRTSKDCSKLEFPQINPKNGAKTNDRQAPLVISKSKIKLAQPTPQQESRVMVKGKNQSSQKSIIDKGSKFNSHTSVYLKDYLQHMQQQIKPFKKNDKRKAAAPKKEQLSQKTDMDCRNDSVSDLMPIQETPQLSEQS